MSIDQRALTKAEYMYLYRNSPSIKNRVGLIGYLRGDFNRDGKSFFTSWFDDRKDLKTDEFSQALNEVINFYRFEEISGLILKDRAHMRKFLSDNLDHSTNDHRFVQGELLFGMRVDYNGYAFLFRFIPHPGDYDFYVWCYKADWLDAHLKAAETGIDIRGDKYASLFRLPDGGELHIVRPSGGTSSMRCRFIDPTHFEDAYENVYHVDQFAELVMKEPGTVVHRVLS